MPLTNWYGGKYTPPLITDKTLGNKNASQEVLELRKRVNQLEEEVKFWSNKAQTHLTNLTLVTAKLTNAEEEIKEVKKQLKKKDLPGKKVKELVEKIEIEEETKEE